MAEKLKIRYGKNKTISVRVKGRLDPIFCAKNRQVDESKFFSNMILDGGPHLIDLATEAKVFNF